MTDIVTRKEEDLMTEEEEDQIVQASIRSGANRSLSILEKGFIRNGSGRYFVLRTTDPGHTLQARERAIPSDTEG